MGSYKPQVAASCILGGLNLRPLSEHELQRQPACLPGLLAFYLAVAWTIPIGIELAIESLSHGHVPCMTDTDSQTTLPS